jgi:hypothetical protein
MKKLKLFQADNGVNYLVPFILVTTLFFLWGFAHSILDVLNKHFQDAFTMNKTRSALVQAVVYGGYFIMALPAGRIIRRFGYRTGVSTGLLLYGIGGAGFVHREGILEMLVEHVKYAVGKAPQKEQGGDENERHQIVHAVVGLKEFQLFHTRS